MSIKSLGNQLASFRYRFGSTGVGGGTVAIPVSNPISVTGGTTSYTFGSKTIHVWTSPGPFVLTGGPGPVEYFVVGGGGAGGADMGGGGGGGGVLTGELTLGGPFSTTVTVGPGGSAHPRGTATPDTAKGSNSVLNNPVSTITAYGGGFGQGDNDPDVDFAAETNIGSGGGGFGQGHPNAGGPAPNYPGPNQQGTPGYNTAPTNFGGGGGGAGAPAHTTTYEQQDGGYGLAIPTTFRDPTNPYGGPSGPPQTVISGGFYFAGGGGGGNPVNGSAWGGGGAETEPAAPGTSNTGGGGAGGPGSGGNPGGDGGSGIVFIAYTTPA